MFVIHSLFYVSVDRLPVYYLVEALEYLLQIVPVHQKQRPVKLHVVKLCTFSILLLLI